MTFAVKATPVPLEWSVGRFKDFGTFQTGRDHSFLDVGDVPVYGSSKNPFAYVDRPLARRRAFAIGRKGTIDKPFMLPESFWAVDTCMFYRPAKSSMGLRYSYYWATTIDWVSHSTKTALPSLTQTAVNNIHILVPPLTEQIAIADYLDKTTALLDKQRALLERKKALLQEHKKALIHEAVTKGLTLGVAMKPSGVEWIGDVPSHWHIKRCKDVMTYKKALNFDRSEKTILSLTLDGVRVNDPSNPIGLVPADYASYQVFQANDLVFKLIDLENLRTSRVGLVPMTGAMSPAYIRMSPLESYASAQFLHYFFISMWHLDVFQSLGGIGVRSSLTANELGKLEVIVPPISEQLRIAAFVKNFVAVVNRQVLQLDKKIGLIQQLKFSIVHETVTRGVPAQV